MTEVLGSGLRLVGCLAGGDEAARVVHAVRPEDLIGAGRAALLATLPAGAEAVLAQAGFTAACGERPVLVGQDAVLGLGEERSAFGFGGLAAHLPPGVWRLAPGGYDPVAAMLGFALGAYRFERYRKALPGRARLVPPPGSKAALELAAGIWLARDLINTPANHLGPAELAACVQSVGVACGAAVEIIEGAALAEQYPAVAAVGAGSDRPGCVVIVRWQGSTARADAPLVSLCGKGVVFDSGGLDIKPSAGMLRMKKDMGGAAILLGVAEVLMRRDLPIRLELRVGCVENAISGRAMRPGDVLATRAGLQVEVGNTDAEGRLVLADLLADAACGQPAILIDCATLTGAARVATGPDLPALFCNDEAWAARMLAASVAADDPVWRLPLWDGYDGWLASPVADVNSVSAKPMAGAIVAALFLRRFVPAGQPWVHLDTYAWNDSDRPGRPEGGDAQGLRAIVAAITDAVGGVGGGTVE